MGQSSLAQALPMAADQAAHLPLLPHALARTYKNRVALQLFSSSSDPSRLVSRDPSPASRDGVAAFFHLPWFVYYGQADRLDRLGRLHRSMSSSGLVHGNGCKEAERRRIAAS